MADMNILANDVPVDQALTIAPLTRVDDHILPLRKWVPVGKSNYVLHVLRSQSNLIVKTMPSQEKKKTTHLLIPSIRFTKLIIHHLKTKHNTHPRTGSSLHYSHKDNVLGNLNIVGKDGKEVFDGEHGMADKEAVPEYLKATKGKGKEKLTDEHVTHTLLDLNTPKKKIATDQYILQKRTPKTAEPTRPDSVNKEKDASNKELTKINAGVQDERKAESNPGKQDEGHAGSNSRNDENLKLLTEDHVILKEHTSSTRTLSSLQNLEKELSFTDQFFMEKPQEEEQEKTNAESETGDMRTFMNWDCQKVGKTELTQADFEGQAYEVVKAFYPDVIRL
nr:hypothetical protein [Tanacetum cinerariifolium]